MSKSDTASIEALPISPADSSRTKKHTVAGWIFIYLGGIASIGLGTSALYVFVTGNWGSAEVIASAAKMLAMLVIAYLIRAQFSK